MKKWITLLLAMTMVMSMAMTMATPASAAVTGEWTDKTLEIAGLPAEKAAEQTKMEKGKNNVHDFSEFGTTDPGTKGHRMTYEYNQDLLDTVLLKQDNDRNPNLTEYITYKMDKNIAGFELDVLCCAGLGDPRTDLSVFISKTGAEGSWAQIKTQATFYEFDTNYYITWEKAYWFHSTLTNAQEIPTGYKYLKIQFNPCNDQGEVPWNVAVDDVKIIMGSKVPPVTIPEGKKLTKTWEEINAERDATRTTKGTGTTTAKPIDGGNTTTAAGGGNNTTTAKPITTTTSIGANGEVITDAPATTTTATNEQGEVITDAPTTATNAQGEVITTPVDGNQDTDTGADGEDGGNGIVLWIIIGAVVLAAAAVAVYFLVIKKKG